MRPEVTGRKLSHPVSTIEADAYSIDEFCARHRISRRLFYKLKSEGLMPPTFYLGTRVLISREAAAVWLRACENGSSTA
ncbi:hypothetical protein JQ614_19455 [Bradyrhizobium diazoefficiens]|uniref:Helix-turn-helix domain-containing protein n=1 Tax=Bradyrhizobium diazoefficiens TaxID=1355477 RepID=A0A0E4BXG8_9BRAD|nr:hypothetical protein [Bradyrhizobium diazoefficiens]MBR0863343.1 hypothetical protein [Bradyrhizobium diazoefficiens]MBR0887907.1 hypothetical protein [Bradyrhizobium diazoefficiens]MBR0920224.1 hypothetical protein [Bradyrhizobium diazoefficiens]BAR62426.1 hypothetical protein NK6_9287 [Bradyrhizobium diazoefficiens]